MITKIPPHILAPLALTIVITGTLYSTGNVGGIVLLIAFGILGWLMKALGWSRPALLLAFILGPIIETFYFHTTMIYGTAWLLRPSVIVILACACGIIYLGIVLQRKAKEAGVD
jgi:TctA family transporter